MNKKAVSPLIAYILLIGMVVAMSVIVGNFLIKQARDVNFDSKEIEIYCADAAIDAYSVCSELQGTEVYIIGFNMTNRGYFNISDVTIVRKTGSDVKTLTSDEFTFFTYNGGSLNTQKMNLAPGNRALLKIAGITTSTEIFITPKINVNEKTASCNEKVFKLSNIQPIGGQCPT